MTDANLYTHIDAIASARGAAQCWIALQRGAWTFDDVRRLSNRYAIALAQLGVEPGDRVLAQIEKSPEALILYLACLRAGAVFVPLNTACTTHELQYFVVDAEPRVLVADPARAEATRSIAAAVTDGRVVTLDGKGGGELPTLASRVTSDDAALLVAREPDDLAAIIYTSGTTGRSKGAMLSQANLATNAEALVSLWRFNAADVLLHALPVHHIHGLFVATHCALLSGATTLLLPKFEVRQVIELLPRTTVFMGVPTYYTRLLADGSFGREHVGRARLFVCGSAPLLAGTFEDFEKRTGHRILERYGMTEAGIITSNPYTGERVAGTVGFAVPGVCARVADASGTEVARATAGVLEIRGPNVFRGYWRAPEKTAAEFRTDGYFITGDIATMDTAGRIAIVGRARDLIISGGFNVYPKEIELAIDALPGVVESAVVGVPHPDFGEAVIAIVAHEPQATLTEEGVLDALRSQLARFKQPKRVYLVAELPRNAMGKVQKNLLREQYAHPF
jgi:malonyl-CoA/methylmalonyl-CoA synthetase